MPLEKKYKLLKEISSIVGAKIYGLDTSSKEEFRRCIKENSGRHKIVISAGGDGTFSDLINSVDLSYNVLSHIPIGTGNAIKYALGLPCSPLRCAIRIKRGKIRKLDLIRLYDKSLCFMCSVGFEADVLRLMSDSYLRATMSAIRRYRLFDARICADGKTFQVKDAISIIITKQPYYGYGMKIMPEARFDDGKLHIRIFSGSVFKIFPVSLISLFFKNFLGNYICCEDVRISLSEKKGIQGDGDFKEEAKKFFFKVEKDILRVIC